MTVKDLFTEIRYQMSDELKTGYKDQELIVYLNQTQEYVYTLLIDHASNYALKRVELTLTNGSGDLPADFETESAVNTDDSVPSLESVAPNAAVTSISYKIINKTIYSDNDSLILYYYYLPDTYSELGEELTCPRTFQNLYRQMIIFLAMNSDEFDTSVEQALMTHYESKILSLIGKRGSSNARTPMPFMV